jgi:hypothetical protein
MRLKCYEHNEWMNNERMPAQAVTARMVGVRKRRPWKRWTDEIKEDLKVIGIRNCHTVARDKNEGRRVLLVNNEV